MPQFQPQINILEAGCPKLVWDNLFNVISASNIIAGNSVFEKTLILQ